MTTTEAVQELRDLADRDDARLGAFVLVPPDVIRAACAPIDVQTAVGHEAVDAVLALDAAKAEAVLAFARWIHGNRERAAGAGGYDGCGPCLLYRAGLAPAGAEGEQMTEKCPTCGSPAPHLHPAMQFEGEVQPCGDPFHDKPTNQNPPRFGPSKDADVEFFCDAHFKDVPEAAYRTAVESA